MCWKYDVSSAIFQSGDFHVGSDEQNLRPFLKKASTDSFATPRILYFLIEYEHCTG